jgi:hypothetical protein
MFTMRTYERCTRHLAERAVSAPATFDRWRRDARSIELVMRRAVREGYWPLRKNLFDRIRDSI